MSDFTPTTPQMREAYANWRRKWQQDGNPVEELDRWAHSEFRPWVVNAWDEGYAEGLRQGAKGRTPLRTLTASKVPAATDASR